MRQRWMTIVLAVSVGLNLFFLGVSAARWWQHQKWRSEHWGRASSAEARGQEGDGGRPEPRRGGSRRGRGKPLSWMTEAERTELRPKRAAIVGIRRDAEQVLRAEPFDSAKFQSTLQALRAETAQIQMTVHEKLVQRAATLSPEERRKLVDVSWGTPGERGRTSRQRD